MAEGREAERCVRQMRLEQAIKSAQRFVVETYSFKITRIETCFAQAVADGVLGKARVVLLSREAFLLRGSHDFSVDYQCCCRVVVERRDAQDRRHSRGLGLSWTDRAFGIGKKPPLVGFAYITATIA